MPRGRNLLRALAAGLRPRRRVREQVLSTLTPAVLERLRQDPATLRPAYDACAAELRAGLGSRFGHLIPREREFAFCTVVAHSLAGWGAESTCVTFPDLLREPCLNCGNYGLLVHDLAGVLRADAAETARLRVVGWDGPAMGNHQMLFLDRPEGGRSLLLDPTVGLIGDTGFDTVAAGRPVPAGRLVKFRVRGGIEEFEALVVGALLGGRVRPSELLYYFDGFDHLLGRYGHPRDWPTPGACAWRARAGVNS